MAGSSPSIAAAASLDGDSATQRDASASTSVSASASASASAFSLQNILGENHDTVEHPKYQEQLDASGSVPAAGWDEEGTEHVAPEGFCVECEDQPAQLHCEACAERFCEVCFAALHRKGTRKAHATKALEYEEPARKKAKTEVGGGEDKEVRVNGEDIAMNSDEELEMLVSQPPAASTSTAVLSPQPSAGADAGKAGDWFLERAKYIPLRLTLSERKFLRLLEAALQVSEYTDRIDTLGFGLSKAKRIVQQIRELCAILSGLVLSADYKAGQELFQDRDFASNDVFYQQIFELGRRHKIMNPDKMRTTYGKLIYLLQDSQTPEVKDLLSFSCVKPIKTVYSVLEEHGALALLTDDLILAATREIYAEGRTRRDVQKEIRIKERAIETLGARYARDGLDEEKVKQCLYSIGDNHAFLRTNRDPCERMIEYLKEHFHPTQATSGKASLAIRSGKGGARLSHDHARQYAYVLQSLTLWREILHDMFRLWSLAEQDLLSENVPYRLRDTGQGLNRVQAAPKTSRMMHAILDKAQQSVGSWVGSSAIHMGDHNVPNALMFIDKYSQIYRILLPICNTLAQIPALADVPALRSYIEDEFGSPEACAREILGDFFRHGFDGSGADNFFDAGSCIDGRLTSAWNWCSNLEKKRYFHVFLLTGFVGFDGDW
ncbi:hypothetical protein CONPUDRAFT_130825 [Coniophora puteana RWD-64-598 SS2]|uniref:B box-type domain-containing protein n=1 Tax=Coniophora puteana (strain RWD-64-598) TaxID=741705 RepID=A0A5M3MAP6_CONPW|nr:uncharacterized protein CONPUDRAFT_130825 [Coniophora puteana RWD-64-598 SS2]EIW76289.1 hypothetical protein CONPUDRAFT_130825 [Coniophora puteana RWD-64-598 SS2]